MSLQNRPSPSPHLKQLCHWDWDPSPTECHGQLGLPTPAHSFRSPLDLKKKKRYPCFTFSALRKLSPDLYKKRLKCLKVVWGEHRFALTSLWQDVSIKKFGRVTRIVLQGNQTKMPSSRAIFFARNFLSVFEWNFKSADRVWACGFASFLHQDYRA